MSSTDLLMQIILAVVGILSILGTALIANYSIRKTAMESRISTVHKSMRNCLAETIDLIGNLFILAKAIETESLDRKVVSGEDTTESAWDRYWNHLDEIVDKSRRLYTEQLLYLPQSSLKPHKASSEQYAYH